jgi:hypothetical protein
MEAYPCYSVANGKSCTGPVNSKHLPADDCKPIQHHEPALIEDLWEMDASPWYGVENGPSFTTPEIKNKPLHSCLVDEGQRIEPALLLKDLWEMDASPWYGTANGLSKPLTIEPSASATPLGELFGKDHGAASPSFGIAKGSSCSTRLYENKDPLPFFLPRIAKAFVNAPSRFDVLFGKGKALREHTGNVRANHLVAMYRPKYEQADKYDKTEIAKRLVNVIHESGGRFLKFDENEGCWVTVGHGMAREKISHIFRNQRDRKKRNDRN